MSKSSKHVFFSYYWFLDEKEEDVTSIRIYGINDKEENICVRVDDFQPYVYIELPSDITWTGPRAQILGNKLDQLIPKNKAISKSFEMKYKLYGVQLDEKGNRKKFPYLKCTFSHKDDIKKLGYALKKSINVLGIGFITLKMHEQDADPILQFVSNLDIPTAGWICFKGQEVEDSEKITLCHKEYIVKSRNICKYTKNTVGNIKIMGFDIEVNSTNPFAMPSPLKPGDKVFQISCVFTQNDSGIYDNYLLTLGEPDQNILGDDINIKMFDTEYELLEGFTELIREKNPNIIVGYNILQFDIHYMIERAKREFCGIFYKMGFHKYNNSKEKTIKWSSSAYKNQEFQFLDAEGRIFVDLLPLIQRDYKFNNYQLKTVSINLLGDTKDDLSVKNIFKCYRIGTKKELGGTYSPKAKKAMGIVGRYCVKDSILVVKLMEKMQTWVGLCEQAKTYNTSIFSIYTQGQQIKVFSQVYKYCLYNDIVVEKDGYIAKEDERYVGAHVFPPVPGLYNRVLPFDFSSLYPTTIIAYNIDYSTIVFDDSIPDKLCNVMSWSDHTNCIVEGSNITVNGFGIDIKNLENNNNLILTHSEKTNLLEYKNQINFFNKDKKECIEITFEDGSTLKCTPDHKIITSKHIWVEAKDLKINETKIKKGITFPLTNFKDFISDFNLDCKNLKLNMNNIFEIEKFCKFSRLFGMLYTDGCLDKNRASIYTGDIVDANCVINDIYDVCGVKNYYKLVEKDNGKYFHITVPYEFHNSYIWNLGDGYGARTVRNSILPSYILNTKCPIILKREFIAGMFGGDGLTVSYSAKTKNYRTIGFCISKISDKIDNAKEFLNSIQDILKKDFDINSYINGPYKKKDKDIYTLVLYISVNDLIKFKDTVGFRYCTYKSFRLDVLCSYKNLINKVFEERENSFEIIKKLHKTLSWDEAVKEGHKIIKQHEIIFNNHYAFPNKQSVIDSVRRPRNGNKKTFWSSKFPSFEKYLKELNVYDFFVDNKNNKDSSTYCMNQTVLNDIPYYELKVIAIKSIGLCNVFDLEIEDNHSFLSNGIVVHNCSHDPKVIRKNQLTTYIDKQQLKLKELREKRDKKINKIHRDEIVKEIDSIIEEMKPYREERAQISKTISKNVMCADRYYRFLKEPKGVIPTILQNLLDARSNTRVEIKSNNKKILEIEDKDKLNDLKLLNVVLDKRQLAYKISANSMYGAMGVKKGYLPFMPGAMSCTYMGRTNIEIVAKVIPEKYGGELVYGDSVTGDTPILCKINGNICYRTIDNIPNFGWNKYRTEKEYALPNNVEVWSERGFTKIKNIIRHKTNKKIYRILTHTGVVDATEDHGLLDSNSNKISPTEIRIGSKLLISDLPELKEDFYGINKDLAFVMGLFYADGSCGNYCCPSGNKNSWAINKSNRLLLEKCKDILNKSEKKTIYELEFTEFKIYETMESSSTLKLEVIGNDTKNFVKIWRELFYDNNKYKKIPDEIFRSTKEIRQSFLDGYYSRDGDKDINGYYRFDNKGKIGSAGLYLLATSLGYKVSINTRKDKPLVYRLTCTKLSQRKLPHVVKKINLIGEIDDYVYDIETENSHFSAGIGKLIVHNTDSNYIHFPHLKTAHESWEHAEMVAEEVSKLFPKPISLAFEEAIYWQFFILTKKRYMYKSCGKNGVIQDKIGKKGVILSRRDSAVLIRTLYERVIEMIFDNISHEDILYFIIQELNKICSNSFTHKDYVITKAVGDVNEMNVEPFIDEKGIKKARIGNYTVPILPTTKTERDKQLLLKDAEDENEYYKKCLPAVVQLAEKMRSRGQRVDAGTRLEYVIIDNGIKNDKQYNKLENLDYFESHSDILKIDFMYYVKLLINPIDQLLNVAFDNEKNNKKYKYRYKKDFLLHQYDFRSIIRAKVIEQIKNLFKPKIEFEKK